MLFYLIDKSYVITNNVYDDIWIKGDLQPMLEITVINYNITYLLYV